MRMMLRVLIPTETGNQGREDGSLARILEGAMNKLKPEAAYFLPQDGVRSAMLFFEMQDTSEIPAIVEPFFKGLNAEVELVPVMNANDLQKGLKAVDEQTK
jgi:hypothetical protein